MKNPNEEIQRREFNQLAMAALTGVVTGTMVGCGGGEVTPGTNASDSNENDSSNDANDSNEGDEKAQVTQNDWMGEKHVCRGLNKCKGLGKDGKNDCAGQGTCHTFAEHSCAGNNDCRFQGGCGADPAQNSCKGEGKCHIPLMDKAWESARKSFEKAMETAGKEFGDAPPKS